MWNLVKNPQNIGVMFPEILSVLPNKTYRRNIYGMTAAALEAGAIRGKTLSTMGARIIRDFREAQRLFADKKQSAVLNVAACYTVAVVTVMQVFADQPEVRETLLAAVEHDNAQVAFAAFRACRKLGWETAPETIERFAADVSTRLDLFEELEKAGQQDLFPRKWRTQELFAEGDMVRWVARKNDFAPPPTNLKLLETRVVKVLGKQGRIYIYKFKQVWNGRNWMIGISGPQPMDSNEIVTRGAGTFSANCSLRNRDMDEHLRNFRAEVVERSVDIKRRRRK